MTRAQTLFLDCLRGALQEDTVAVTADDLPALWKLAKFHHVENMLCYVLERSDALPTEVLTPWREARDAAVLQYFAQTDALAALLTAFDSAEISALVLKGSLLRRLYPQEDYRTMADLDLLVHEEDLPAAAACLEGLGYHGAGSYQQHTSFSIPPYLEVELHTQLVEDTSPLAAYNRYAWEDTQPLEGYRLQRCMAPDAEYLFTVVHFAKHYFYGGSGVRSVADLFLFRERYAAQLNTAHIAARLAELDLTDFARQAEQLSQVWFGEQAPSDALTEMADYILTSGLYGTKAHHIDRVLKEQSGRSYLWKRVAVPREKLQSIYPVLRRYPALTGVVRVWFVTKTICGKPKRVLGELKLLRRKRQ